MSLTLCVHFTCSEHFQQKNEHNRKVKKRNWILWRKRNHCYSKYIKFLTVLPKILMQEGIRWDPKTEKVQTFSQSEKLQIPRKLRKGPIIRGIKLDTERNQRYKKDSCSPLINTLFSESNYYDQQDDTNLNIKAVWLQR